MAYKILAINPGSTSTKIALFEGDQEIFKKNVVHEAVDLAKYATVADQLDYRVNTILSVCSEQGVDLASCDAFVGRGGGLNSCPGGTYEVNETMLAHAKRGGGNHPASLAARSPRNLPASMASGLSSSTPPIPTSSRTWPGSPACTTCSAPCPSTP